MKIEELEKLNERVKFTITDLKEQIKSVIAHKIKNKESCEVNFEGCDWSMDCDDDGIFYLYSINFTGMGIAGGSSGSGFEHVESYFITLDSLLNFYKQLIK